MSGLQVFGFNGCNIRMALIGVELWWVAKDIAEALDYAATSRMLPLVEEEDRQEINPRDYPELVQSLPDNSFRLSVLNESGLYACIFNSTKPQAKSFKKWITTEVLA